MRPEVARRYLEKALKLAEASTKADDTRLIPRIKQQITVLSELTSGPLGFLGGFGGSPFGGAVPVDDGHVRPFDVDDDDDDDDDDFDDPGPYFGRSLPRRPSPGQKRKHKK